MNLNSDIIKYAIPHSCKQCIHYGNCNFACYKADNPRCWRFVPDNMNAFLNGVITYFRLNISKSNEKRLKRVYHCKGTYNDKVTTLDEYYVNFINDCIGELNKNNTVYVFNLSQIAEIMRFCRDLVATNVGNGIIALRQYKSK